MTKPYRPKKDTVQPCAICGWAKHTGIHLPKVGSKEPWGHAYVPPKIKEVLHD